MVQVPIRSALTPFVITLSTLAIACQPATEVAEVAEPREVRQYTIDEFLGTTSFVGSSFSPDGSKLLVSSDESGIFNAYAIDVESAERTQLTDSTTESIFALEYFPHDERFLYRANEGGNELDHIFVQELDGTVQDLTPGEGLRANFLGWSDDDSAFYVQTNERDQRFFDVYEYSVEDYSRELIYENESGFNFADISPDRRHIALAKTVTNADSDIYLFDRESGETDLLASHDGEVNHFPVEFTKDGSSLLFSTDLDSEFLYLVQHSLGSGDRDTVVQVDWDVSFAGLSEEGKYLVVGINNDAVTELQVIDRATGEQITLPELPEADITTPTISRGEDRLAFYVSSSSRPRDLFVMDLGSGEVRQLTTSLNPEIAPEDLVGAEVVRFASFDDLQIPGVLYKPHQASPDNPVPAVVWVHGGPGGQSRVGYNGLIQYLANHGYAVYAINNRGSSGYGKTFHQMDDRAHGEGDLDDCVASKQMLIDTGWVDPDRIGILGGSYGGYMVLAALAFRPEEFDVGVDIFGISNWHRTVQNIPPWWESFRAALEKEMGDFDDEEYFRSISPLFHAENIVKPLMVIQGANDPRVLKVESDDIVAAVEANGVPVDYLVFDDEGHGFAKKENREEAYTKILAFLDQYLRGVKAGVG